MTWRTSLSPCCTGCGCPSCHVPWQMMDCAPCGTSSGGSWTRPLLHSSGSCFSSMACFHSLGMSPSFSFIHLHVQIRCVASARSWHLGHILCCPSSLVCKAPWCHRFRALSALWEPFFTKALCTFQSRFLWMNSQPESFWILCTLRLCRISLMTGQLSSMLICMAGPTSFMGLYHLLSSSWCQPPSVRKAWTAAMGPLTTFQACVACSSRCLVDCHAASRWVLVFFRPGRENLVEDFELFLHGHVSWVLVSGILVEEDVEVALLLESQTSCNG